MHFGLYLKKKGIISAEQLVAAIEIQLATIPKIGQIALEEGIISPREIFDVLRAQSASPNVRFGDLAIELGLMTRDDLMRLLMIQADRKRPIAEILVAQGVLSQQQVDSEMAAQRRGQFRPKSAPTAATARVISAPRGSGIAERQGITVGAV
jgi:hypothetical protein